MSNLSAHQEYLLLGKVTGSLSPGEHNEFEKLLAESDDANLAYSDLLQQLPQQLVNNSFADYKKDEAWPDLIGRFSSHVQKPVISLFRKVAAAAVAVGVITGGWYLVNKKQHAEIAELVSPVKNERSIQLELANGQKLDLSARQGHLQAGNTRLTNNNKQLKYKTTGAAQETNVLTVPVGMDYKITLEDGSEVWLNSATRFEFPFAFLSGSREVRISGEAYLKIVKDAPRPFLVHLPEGTVQVLGTEFNVNSYDPGVIKVALVEGAVHVDVKDRIIDVKPGREIVYDNKKVEDRALDTKLVLSWRNGLFYFNDATLLEISKVLPRWFGVNVVIDNPDLNKKTFVGVLDKKQPVSVFLDDLKAILRIEGYFDANGTLHFK